MARTSHLPLYATTYILIREVHKIRIKLPKLLKYDLGQEVFQSALKMLKCIVVANRAYDKTRHIMRLLLEIEVQWALLRLLYDLKGISEGEFKVLSGRLSEIGKQSQAWLKWQRAREKPKSVADPHPAK